MAETSIPSFDEAANLARVNAGFRGGNRFFSNPNLAPSMTIESGFPKEVDMKLQAGMIDQPTPTDPWVVRYPNAKL